MIVQLVDKIAPLSRGNSAGARFFHDRKTVGTPAIGQNGLTYSVIIIYKKTNPNSEIIVETNEKIIDGYSQIDHNGGEETGVFIPYNKRNFIVNLMREVSNHKFIVMKPAAGEIIRGEIIRTENLNWFIRNSDPDVSAAVDYLGVIAVNPKPGRLTVNDGWLQLPRFITSPEFGYEQIGQDLRGSVGQPYGRTIKQLRTLSVKYVRVSANLIDNYYRKAGTTVPHWVVPYPEAVSKFPPMWATLTEPPKFTKRAENGWYWNVSLSWKEAY